LLVIKGPKFIDELDSYCHLFKGYHEAPISKDLPGNSLFLFNFLYHFWFLTFTPSWIIDMWFLNPGLSWIIEMWFLNSKPY
jgi:hypothetical protein